MATRSAIWRSLTSWLQTNDHLKMKAEVSFPVDTHSNDIETLTHLEANFTEALSTLWGALDLFLSLGIDSSLRTATFTYFRY